MQVKPVKYLVCVNDTEHSRIALKFACARAKKRGSRVDILHVVEPVDFEGFGAIANKMHEENRAKAEAFLEKMADEVKEMSGVTPTLVLKEGNVEGAILSAVQDDIELNMLIVGASPTRGGRHMHITTLVKELGDKLMIPLVLVPGNLTDQQIEELA